MSDVPPSHSPPPPAKGLAVFLCSCRGAVSEVIDLEALMARLLPLPLVRSVDLMAECCRPEDMDRMELALRSGEVDRFMIAGCSYRDLVERMYQVAREGGIDPYLVEVCNLREQCALAHGKDGAQGKAERLLDMSMAKCLSLQVPPHRETLPTSKTIMVLGGGHSACVAAQQAHTLGHEVILVNLSSKVVDEAHGEEVIDLEAGGFERFLAAAGGSVMVTNDTVLTGLRGQPGDLTAVLDTPLGSTELKVGALVVALDMEGRPNPLHDRYQGEVITQDELAQRLRLGAEVPNDVVMLAMDEEGESAFDPLSTHEAVHNALFLRSTRPRSAVTIVTREVFAFGQCEAGYRKAMEVGTRVLRSDGLPEQQGKKLIVHDVHLGEQIALPFDLLVIDNAMAMPNTRQLAKVLGVPIDAQGRFLRPNAKLKPSSSVREGVFLCGTAMERSLGAGPSLEARAAVTMASALLAAEVRVGGEVAEVYADKCSACLSCVRSCPYRAPQIGAEGKAAIDIALCQGCGMCVSICPSKAIQQYSFRDDQIESQLQLALRRSGT